jgi:hypothetical protein
MLLWKLVIVAGKPLKLLHFFKNTNEAKYRGTPLKFK